MSPGEAGTKVLNRIVRITLDGYDMEGSPRHRDGLLEQMIDGKCHLDTTTPGFHTGPINGTTTTGRWAFRTRQFRNLIARCWCLSLDRPDTLAMSL